MHIYRASVIIDAPFEPEITLFEALFSNYFEAERALCSAIVKVEAQDKVVFDEHGEARVGDNYYYAGVSRLEVFDTAKEQKEAHANRVVKSLGDFLKSKLQSIEGV